MVDGVNSSDLDYEFSPASGCGENGIVTMKEVIAELRERRENIMNGGINCIPLPFQRFRNELPGLEPEQYIVLTASTKAGKCFGKGTRIRMADNTVKNIEDIRVGDWVMSPDKEAPKRVLSLGHGREKLYRVSSEMHDDLVVNESHIMYMYLPYKKKYVTMTIKDLYEEQCKYSNHYFKHARKAVASDECEYFLFPDLKIEPYFYGLWLGDGATKDSNITTADKEIVDYLKQYADRLGMQCSEYAVKGKCPRYSIHRKTHKDKLGFKRKLGDVCGWQKEHVNREYLNASVESRYQLLAGIIDSDGYLNRHKTGYCITMKYLSCIEDIQELSRSLGLATTIRTKYNKKYKQDYYEIRINGKNCTRIPVKLPRKKCSLTNKDFRHYPITITPLEVGDYYGLTLGGNHLFLLEDYTIVHNTQLASYLMYQVLDYAFEHPDQCSVHIIYFNLEESQTRIKQRYISHLLYKLDGHRLSPRDLRSTSADFPLDEEILDMLDTDPRYQERLEFFDKCVQFETEDTNPTGILRVCEEYAKSVGEYRSVKKKSRGGDQEVEVFQSYEEHDKKHIKFAVIDHGGLVDLERGMTLKQSMDKLSEYAVKYLRNRYRFNTIFIQQQAMESEGLEAIKQKKMLPAVATLGDTKYTARDANYVLGLFDPSFFGLPNWLGYKIQDADGFGLRNYGRFLYIIRGRDGEQGGVCPLFFDGAVSEFEELPKPDDINALTKIYNRINGLKSYKQKKKFSSLILALFNGKH